MSTFDFWRKKQAMKPTSRPAPMEPPPASTEEKPRRNGIFINEQDKSMQVIIYQNNEDSIPAALGSLEMAKDVVKQKMTEWHLRQRPIQPRILVPGNGKSH